MGQLKTRAERWDEWHGTWLETTLNEFFDKYSVKTIKSEILRYILEDDADHDEVKHLMFYEIVRDYMKKKANPDFYTNPDAVPTPATIDTMFELDTSIVGEMYETFCEHYGI